MANDMFVWRKSVYDNNFKCNECGAKLFNLKTGQSTENLVVDANADTEGEKHLCFCAKCHNVVATWQELEVSGDDDDSILRGSYSEWIEKKALDMKGEMQKKVEERLQKKYQNRISMLEATIKTRDATIKRLKTEYEQWKKDHSEQNMKLHQELTHAYNTIEKLQNEIKGYLDEKLNQ